MAASEGPPFGGPAPGGPQWSGTTGHGSLGYGYGPPGYGYGYGYGGPPRQEEHPQGTMVLILGILGLVTCQVMSPIAWVMGNRVLAEIDAQPGRYSNRSLVNAGRICGIVGSVLLGVTGAFFLLYAVIAIGIVASSGG